MLAALDTTRSDDALTSAEAICEQHEARAHGLEHRAGQSKERRERQTRWLAAAVFCAHQDGHGVSIKRLHL